MKTITDKIDLSIFSARGRESPTSNPPDGGFSQAAPRPAFGGTAVFDSLVEPKRPTVW